MVIKNYTFETEPVLMDFHEFRHCNFKKCRLIYCGYSAVTVDSCRFDECRWEFQGPAQATLQFLAQLNHAGSEMGRIIVQQALAVIQQPPGVAPAAAPAAAAPAASALPSTSAPQPPPRPLPPIPPPAASAPLSTSAPQPPAAS